MNESEINEIVGALFPVISTSYLSYLIEDDILEAIKTFDTPISTDLN